MEVTDEQRKQLEAERRAYNKRVEQLKSEYAPDKALNAEYQESQRRIATILGDDNLPVVGTGCRNV
jgi:uncharacterized protein YlxW (UPF0749 family)